MLRRLFTRAGSRTAPVHIPDEPVGPELPDPAPARAFDRRRALRLGGMAAAGVAGATVVTAVNAAPASANNGDALKLGTVGPTNAETSATGLYYNSGATFVSGVYGLGVLDHGTGGFNWSPAIGGVAQKINLGAGVEGNGSNGAMGVVGFSDTSTGVQGGSSAGVGVYGVSTEGRGVFGLSESDVAVYGLQGSGSALTFGVAALVGDAEGTGAGVVGATDGGVALQGKTTTGIGVLGQTLGTANANPAVWGVSAGPGPALRATGKVVPAGTGVGAGNAAALDVHGRATFTRSGLLTIPAGSNNALTALVPGGLAATSAVLATLQASSGALAVKAAVPVQSGTNAGKVQIFLTGNAPAGGIKVAWFVLG